MRLLYSSLTEDEREEIAVFVEQLLYIGETVDPDGMVYWDMPEYTIKNSV